MLDGGPLKPREYATKEISWRERGRARWTASLLFNGRLDSFFQPEQASSEGRQAKEASRCTRKGTGLRYASIWRHSVQLPKC